MSKHVYLSLVAAAVATAFSGQASAVAINGAGASAVSNSLQNIILGSYCTAGTINFYDNGTKATPAGAVYRIQCTNNGKTKLTSAPVDISYDTSGGSWKGLLNTLPPGASSPTTSNLFIAAQSAQSAFPTATVQAGGGTCSAGVAVPAYQPVAGGPTYAITYFGNCATQALTTAPTFGLTDTDGKLFAASAENQPLQAGTETTGPIALVQGAFVVGAEATGFPVSIFGLTFGVAASKQLYLDLQADQIKSGTIAAACSGLFETSGEVAGLAQNVGCAPSISKAQYRAIITSTPNNFNGNLTGVSELFLNGLPAGQTGAITLARRDRGSGSQATSNAFFLNAGCTSAATDGTELAAALPVDAFPPAYNVSYNYTTGGVVTALTAAPAGTYAIGMLSADNEGKLVPNAGFLRIEGQYPSNVNAANGTYTYWTEEQLHCSPGLSGDPQQLCVDLGGQTGSAVGNSSALTFTGIGAINLTNASAAGVKYPFPQAVIPTSTFFHLDNGTGPGNGKANFCTGPYAY